MLLVDFAHPLLPVHLAKLPDAGQGEGDTSVYDVNASHSDQHQSQFVAYFHHVVAVLDDEDTVGFGGDLLPVDDSGFEVVQYLEEDDAVSQI